MKVNFVLDGYKLVLQMVVENEQDKRVLSAVDAFNKKLNTEGVTKVFNVTAYPNLVAEITFSGSEVPL